MDFQKRKSLADMNAVAIAAILRGESRRGAVLWMNMIEELQQWNKPAPPPQGTVPPPPAAATTMFARHHHHLHSNNNNNNNSSRDGDTCRLSAAPRNSAFGTAAPPRPVAAASSATATATRPDAAATATLPLVGITLDPLRHNIQDNLRVPLFNRVFLLPTSTKNDDDDDDDTGVSLDALQAILYYNLALWFHRQGLEVNRTKCLQQALYFYGQSYACLARCLQARNAASSWAALLLAAVYQNSQQVHAELCNFGHARRLRTLLGRVVTTTTTRPAQGDQQVAWTEPDYTTFHVGLFLGVLDDFKLAPAA